MGARIAGIVVAIAIVFSLEYWWLIQWYVAVPLSIIGYLVVRHTGSGWGAPARRWWWFDGGKGVK
jgi:hypothetical protein